LQKGELAFKFVGLSSREAVDEAMLQLLLHLVEDASEGDSSLITAASLFSNAAVCCEGCIVFMQQGIIYKAMNKHSAVIEDREVLSAAGEALHSASVIPQAAALLYVTALEASLEGIIKPAEHW
jgi:hypothetical protein